MVYVVEVLENCVKNAKGSGLFQKEWQIKLNRTIEKRRNIIEILKIEYDYKVVDDSCDKKQALDYFILVIIGTNGKKKHILVK